MEVLKECKFYGEVKDTYFDKAGFCAMNKTLGIMQQMIKERVFNKSGLTNDEQEEGEDDDDEGATKVDNGNLGYMVVYREKKDDEDGAVRRDDVEGAREDEGENGETMTKEEDDKKEGKQVARKSRSKKKKDDKDGVVQRDDVEGAIQDEGKSICKEGKVFTRKTRSEKKMGDEDGAVQNEAKNKKGRTREVEKLKQAEVEGESTKESLGLSTRKNSSKKTIDTAGELKDHPVRKRGLSREADNPKRCKVSTPKGFSNMNKLQRWLDSKESEEIVSPNGENLQREFFEPLLKPKGWLKYKHLDECMCYLGYRVRGKPAEILDTWFQLNLDKEMNRWLSDKQSYVVDGSKMRYLRGELPAIYGKDWKDVDRIYLPFNFKDKHWVALEIQLSKWCVTVYDPGVNLFKLSEVHRLLAELTYIIPVMIAQYEPLATIYEDRRGNPLNVTRVPTLERNKRGGDCGVFTIKYIEMLSSGRKNIVNVGDKFVD